MDLNPVGQVHQRLEAPSICALIRLWWPTSEAVADVKLGEGLGFVVAQPNRVEQLGDPQTWRQRWIFEATSYVAL
ncbi:MAG: hypothetical protein AABM42_02340 [Actinomycetota bacterium]